MPSLEDLPVDQLYNQALVYKQSDDLLGRLVNDPATREQTLRAIKKVNPNLQIPEIDAKDVVVAQIKTTDDQVAELRQQLLTRDIKDRIREERASLKRDHNLSDEDIQRVEALMTDKDAPIPNYAAAVKVFKAEQQMAIPSAGALTNPGFDMPSTDIWGKGISNPAQLQKISMNEAYAALDDIRTGKVKL